VSGRSYLSIGDVLSLLREEFPDVTISKIRFLESQGLVNPERSPSGYRKFYDHDVERLRWVLRQQRENFLPLKVIRDRLGEEDGTTSAPNEPVGAHRRNGAVMGSVEAAPETDRTDDEEHEHRPDLALATTSAVAATPRATTVPITSGAGRGPSEHPRPTGEGIRSAKSPLITGGRSEPPRRAEDAPVVPLRAPGTPSGAERPGPAPTTAPPPAPTNAPPPPMAAPPSATSPSPSSGTAARLGGAPPSAAPSAPSAPATGTGQRPPRDPFAGAPIARESSRGSGPIRSGDEPGRRPDTPHDATGAIPTASRGPASGAAGTGTDAPESAAPGGPLAGAGAAGISGVSLTAEELSSATGLSETEIAALEGFGLTQPMVVAGVSYYDEEALTVAKLVAEFGRFGIEPRHLRPYRNAVEREVGLIEQVVTPLLRQRNPEARQRAAEATDDLARLGQNLRAALLRKELRRQFGS
jgi:DNA-binding transcriptional MerR regulator